MLSIVRKACRNIRLPKNMGGAQHLLHPPCGVIYNLIFLISSVLAADAFLFDIGTKLCYNHLQIMLQKGYGEMITYRKAKPADIPTLIELRLGYMHVSHDDLEQSVFDEIADKTKGYFLLFQ